MKNKKMIIIAAVVIGVLAVALLWIFVVNRSIVPGQKGHYTYRYTDAAPENFSPLSWSSDSERDVLSYTTSSLYMGEEYEPMLASGMPEDVTTDYAGNEVYGVASDATEGYAYRITLREDAVWSDGTKITTADFEYSLKLYLDENCEHRSDYYNSYAAIANAKDYLKDVYVCAYDSENGYAEIDDSELYFSMTQTNGLFKTCSLEEYYAYYYQDKASLFINDSNENIYDKLVSLVGDEEYVLLTDEIKDLLQSLCTNYGTKSDEAYKRLCFYKDDDSIVGWDEVGFIVEDDYTMTFVLSKQVSQQEFISGLSDLMLVHKSMYESNADAYGTSAEQYVSYGPYVVVSYDEEGMVLEANETWFGYSDEAYDGLYQTTDIEISYGLSDEDAKEKFTQGNLDCLDLGENSDSDFGDSSYATEQENSATVMLSVNIDTASLADKGQDGENHVIAAYKDFRNAISMAIDRDAYAASVNPSGTAAYGLFNSAYMADISEMLAYRDTGEAASVLQGIYGETDEEGNFSYYSVEGAAQLLQSAYDACLMDGNIKASDQVIIDCYAIHDGLAEFLQDALDAASVGTSLEGRITVQPVDTISEADIYEEVVSGDTLDVYSSLQRYLDSDYAADDGFCMGILKCSITINDEKTSMTYAQWYQELMLGEYSSVSSEIRIAIAASLESGLLLTYKNIPLYDVSETYVYSQRVELAEAGSLQAQGDAIRYMTYSMDDSEWSKYCKKAKNKLDYEA